MEKIISDLKKSMQNRMIRGVLSVAASLFIIWNAVSLFGDLGFSEEVTNNRMIILVATAILVSLYHIARYVWGLDVENVNQKQQISELLSQIAKLNSIIDDKEQEKQSLFRLMEQYRSRSQEGIINHIKQLAVFSIKQQEWSIKEARVIRLRINEGSNVPGLDKFIAAVEKITVIINLGKQDELIEGMIFKVQDPTDAQEYGTIIVKDVYDGGARCVITQLMDASFWNEALESSRQNRPTIIDASANIIVPDSPLREVPPESAKYLLSWLQSIDSTPL